MSKSRRRSPRETAESPLSDTWRPRIQERAVLVGVGPGIEERDLDELSALASTAGAEPVSRVVQSRSKASPSTYVGKGKMDELHHAIHGNGADAAIFDAELTPGQLRTLEERLGVKVVDRTALILDIFAIHAKSREGKTQVELAQLNYLLPRLRGWGEAMSRLGGGIGTRGPGETKLEVDRQHIQRRIAKLRRDIGDLSRTRRVKRSRREESGAPQIALAGYTNSGKSTLMNAVTEAGVTVADQLFATLDPTTRRIKLPSGRAATISDTVGFVGMLPHELVEAFRSTLEEVTTASLIVHVADASSDFVEEQVNAVREVLGEIGAAAIPEVLALNKSDVLSEADRSRLTRRFPRGVLISALRGDGLEELTQRIQAAVPAFPIEVQLLIPYGRDDFVARLHREAEVEEMRSEPEGTLLRAHVGERLFQAVKEFVVEPEPGRAPAG
ncbi:MAG: GTPase HflX [Actinomycetota bacterium]